MSPVRSRDAISSDLLAFVRSRFLAGDPDGELAEDTPLLELGILNSLNTAVLIAHVRDEFGVTVPLVEVTATTFRDVSSIAALVDESRPPDA